MQQTLSRVIDAPIHRVFQTVSDINNFSKAVPEIVRVEMLSERHTGVGTRFRETRLMNGKETATELEITEYVANERIRLVSDTHGSIWDSVFTVEESDGKTVLTLVLESRPHTLTARIATSLIKGALQSALERDLDAVKAYCEGVRSG